MNSFCSTVTCHKVDAADAIVGALQSGEMASASITKSATAFLQACLMQPSLADSGASLAVLLLITALRPDPGSYHPKHSIPKRSVTAAAHQKQPRLAHSNVRGGQGRSKYLCIGNLCPESLATTLAIRDQKSSASC